MPDIYKYNQGIDKKIPQAVTVALKTKVFSVSKFPKGEINHVYKVTTNKGVVVVRVFRYKNHPADGTLEWIEKQLSKLKIPHAKLLYYTRTNTFFPNGFMILEYIPGLSGTEAVRTQLLTEKQLYFKLGNLLAKIHQIRCKNFGWLNQGEGEVKSFLELQLSSSKKVLDVLTSKGALPKNPYKEIARLLETTIGPLQDKLNPVLLHGDTSETNIIVKQDKQIILIDWDNARAGFWLADYIELSRRQLLDKTWKNNIARQQEARTAFLKGYGKTNLTKKEIQKVEHLLLIVRQIWQMNYYYFDRQEPTNFQKVKRLFYKLLKS